MRPNLPASKQQKPTPADRAVANNRIGLEVRRPKPSPDRPPADAPHIPNEAAAYEPERWDGMS